MLGLSDLTKLGSSHTPANIMLHLSVFLKTLSVANMLLHANVWNDTS
jgi:hypothetical protein